MSWPTAKLDELGKIGRGKSRHRPRNDPSLYGGDTPFIQTADITNASYRILSYKQTYSEKGLQQSKLWDEETLLMTIAGENTGCTAVLDFPACFPDSIVGFIPFPEKSNITFVKHALDLMRAQFRSVSKGATQDNLSLEKILSFEFPAPPIETQHRIGEILLAYDDLIENNRRRIALLEDAARQLYKEWFVRFRFPGHEHVKVTNGAPEGWQRVAFRVVAVVKKGKNITKDSVTDGDVPVVAGGRSPAYYHDRANVLGSAVTISASGANAGFTNYYQQDIWASDCSYLAEEDNENLRYLYLLLKHRQVDLTAMQKGAAQPHVYPKDIERLEVLDAPARLILQFSDWIDPVFDQIATLQKQNDLFAKARDLLLPKLMNGTLTV